MADSPLSPLIAVPMFVVFGDVSQAMTSIAKTLKPLPCTCVETPTVPTGSPQTSMEVSRPEKISPKQWEWMGNLMKYNNLLPKDVCEQFGISSLSEMTGKQASEFIKKYKSKHNPNNSAENFF